MADTQHIQDATAGGQLDSPSTEDYNQIDPGVLDTFPPARFPVDLYQFKEQAGMLTRIYLAGDEVSNSLRTRFRQLSEEGSLFFTRKQIEQYSASVAGDIDAALADPNLTWEEKSNIFIGELKQRQDDFFAQPMPDELARLTRTLEALCQYIVEKPIRIARVVHHMHTTLTPARRRVNASLMGLTIYTEIHRSGLTADTLTSIALGFFLYDVGMTKVSHLMIGRRQKLTPIEQRTVQGHPNKSVEILARLKITQPEILEPAIQHHERLNGKGYPNQLAGEHIGHLGRIIGIADTYSAMITDTPQRKGFSTVEAAAELIKNDESYDPVICRALVRFLQTVPS